MRMPLLWCCLLGVACATPERPRVDEAGQGRNFPAVESQAADTARRRLRQLLDRRIAAEMKADRAGVAAIDAQLRRDFEKTQAVMVTDLSGFTARTQVLGIIGFLAEVRRLFHLAEPLVYRHRAEWVKVDADDLFIVHPDPKAMLALARDLLAAVAVHNQTEPDHPLGLAIGLGFGPTLSVEHDVWGDAVNTASKLGEDVGRAGEVLITEAFRAGLPAAEQASCTPVEDWGARGAKFPFYRCGP